MKLGQPRESHPFDLITHHLSEIAKQLIRQRMRKEPQAHVTYLALKSKVLLISTHILIINLELSILFMMKITVAECTILNIVAFANKD